MGVTKTIENETKEQKGGFLGMLLATLGPSLLGNMLAGKGMLRADYGSSIKKRFWFQPHPLANFEIQKYYQNKPGFNEVYSRENLPKIIKDGAVLVNLDEYADVGTHWIAFYVKNVEIIYFDSFGVEQVLKKLKNLLGIIT